MRLSEGRRILYDRLESEVVRKPTPLVRYMGKVPNGNSIWIKEEYGNRYGSHYDRVYLKLFRHFEERGIGPENWKALETTSGSAGVSFAGIGRELGYECHVLIPEGGEKGREKAIRELLRDPSHLHMTPAEQYVTAFPAAIMSFLASAREKGEKYFYLNHSMGKRGANNEITLGALEEIGREIASQVAIDYFLPAIGNGSSILGPCRAFGPGVKVIGFETVNSAVAFEMLYPGVYKKVFGMDPGTLSRHRLPGTSFNGISCPHLETAVREHMIHHVMLVSDKKTDFEYFSISGWRFDAARLVHWDNPLIKGYEEVGRTTMAGINVALDVADWIEVGGKNLVVIGYDKIDRYDSRY